MRGKLPGLNYPPKLRIAVHLTMYAERDKKKKEVYIVKCTVVVEEHSVVGRS